MVHRDSADGLADLGVKAGQTGGGRDGHATLLDVFFSHTDDGGRAAHMSTSYVAGTDLYTINHAEDDVILVKAESFVLEKMWSPHRFKARKLVLVC